MLKSKFNWQSHDVIEETVLGEGNVLAPVAKLLTQRQLSEGQYHDSFLFKDMQKVIERIEVAVDEQQPILIYGDYDIDGVSASAILVQAIESLGGLVNYYIPNRFYEGYGPNEDAFMEAIGEGYELIITVDNGVSGIEEAKLLAEHQVDYIITDHHQLKEDIPVCYGLLHPEVDDRYPYHHLSGAGVALKVAQALLKDDMTAEYEMYAMLGTIGDVVPLHDENRHIVKQGLKELRKTTNIGLLALARELDINLADATEVTIGFDIGPVINASGRMDEARYALALLLAKTEEEANELAKQLVAFNTARQLETQKVLEEAKKLVEHKNEKVVIAYQEGWHEGVLGIVAGRLARDLQKAVFVLTTDEFGTAKGSARSIEGIHLFDMMTECQELLAKFGGHAQAAGLSLEIENISVFETKMNELLEGVELQSTIMIDETLALADATLELYEQLQQLAPFGEGNRPPIFRFKDVAISNVTCIGNQKQHLKFMMNQDKQRVTVIGFNLAYLAVYLTEDDLFEVVGELKLNEWNGQVTLQLHLQDIKCQSFQLLDLRNTKKHEEYGVTLQDAIKLSSLTTKEQIEHLVIDVLPSSRQELFELIREYRPMTVTLFPVPKSVSIPSREKFGFVYKIAKEHHPLALNEQTYRAFLARGIQKDEVNFILEVFFELELVIIRNGSVFYKESQMKRDLTTAPTYKVKEAQQQLIEFFELSTWREMKEAFIEAREEN